VKKRSKTKRVIPVWIKVISVIYFIYAFLNVLAGISITFFGNRLDVILADIGLSMTLAMLTVVGLFVAALGVFYFFVGKELWKGKSWARIAAMILSSVSGLFYLINLFYVVDFFAVVVLITDVAILLYLLFNKDAKKAFS